MGVRLIISDNQDVTQAGMHYLAEKCTLFSEIVEISSKSIIIAQLEKRQPTVVILDYTNSEFNSADELLILRERFPWVNWILFSDTLSTDFLHRVVYSSSAFSVVFKECSRDEIISSLRNACRGERYLCNKASNQLINSTKEVNDKVDHSLTATEIEILKEIAKGKTTKEIAAERNLSFHTISTHRKNIFRKIQVNNVHEATRYAMRAGLIDWVEYYI